jgi:hypothetical protein
MKMKVRALILCMVTLPICLSAVAQTCSNTAATNELICSVPQLFGPGGLTLPNTAHKAHFTSASLNTFKPLNAAIGEELSTLPLGSSGSGISFTFDQALHIPVSSEDSLGPILTDRAATIGKKRINVGVAYQYFSFSEIDGLDLSHLPAVLGHAQFNINGSKPDFENDYITTSNNVDVTMHQAVLYGVVGLTDRLEFSVAVPIESVHLNVSSNALIVRTVACELNGTCTGPGAQCGEFHYFVAGNPCDQALGSTSKTFTNGSDATGLGDVTLRGKFQIIKGERIAVAAGLDLRLPSGDAKNFLGAGTTGVSPFGAFTYRGRVSPHVRMGYQWNGDSVLAGDPTAATGSTAGLPHEFFYSAGVDARVTHRLTVAADILGQHVFSASRLKLSSYTAVNGKVSPDIQSYVGSYDSDGLAFGVKVRIVRQLVATGNLTARLNSGGLRADVVPLVGLSYAF